MQEEAPTNLQVAEWIARILADSRPRRAPVCPLHGGYGGWKSHSDIVELLHPEMD